MNLIEVLIVAAAAQHMVKNPVCPETARFIDGCASEVVAEGMTRAGFRYVPGILRCPYPPRLYEAQAAVSYLTQRKVRTDA